jgi:PLP dependent protein
MGGDRTHISVNIDRLSERIAAAAARSDRRADEITLVAVSKTFSGDAIRAAYSAGLRHFGESRVQEWEAKRAGLSDLSAWWHFIGHLQTNKARRAVELFDRVDSIDDPAIARRLDEAATEQNKRLPVLIEVRLGGEPGKSGVSESKLPGLAEAVLKMPHLELLGLMSVPPYFEEPWQARPFFRRLRELRDDLSERMDWPLAVLSMGMSHDFEIAIEEGATEIRVGTAIFGDRPL